VGLLVGNRLSWQGHRQDARTYWKYQTSFYDAGLRLRSEYVLLRTPTDSLELVPLMSRAIRYFARKNQAPAGKRFGVRIINFLKRIFACEFFWRTFGPDYLFVLEKAEDSFRA
jgi:hypothetical protein